MFSFAVLLFAIGAAHAANDPDCGSKGPAFVSRIVGGQNTAPLEYPWQISLQRFSSSAGWYHTCGGSVINKDWVLTAAHCIDGVTAVSTFRARMGEHNRAANEGTEVELNIQKMFKHPNWDSAAINNDVALLKLERSLDLNGAEKHIGTVCLPEKQSLDQIVGTKCVATGWGNTAWQGTSPNILQKVTIDIWTQSRCIAAYSSVHPITNGMICFGENNKGTCQGDSGGPLNCKVGDKWYTYGTTSFGVRCAGPTYASVSARNSEYSDWIWQTVAAN